VPRSRTRCGSLPLGSLALARVSQEDMKRIGKLAAAKSDMGGHEVAYLVGSPVDHTEGEEAARPFNLKTLM